MLLPVLTINLPSPWISKIPELIKYLNIIIKNFEFYKNIQNSITNVLKVILIFKAGYCKAPPLHNSSLKNN